MVSSNVCNFIHCRQHRVLNKIYCQPHFEKTRRRNLKRRLNRINAKIKCGGNSDGDIAKKLRLTATTLSEEIASDRAHVANNPNRRQLKVCSDLESALEFFRGQRPEHEFATISGSDKAVGQRIQRGECCGCDDVKRLLHRETTLAETVYVIYETCVHHDNHVPTMRRTYPWQRAKLDDMKNIIDQSDAHDTKIDIFRQIPRRYTVDCGVDFNMFRKWLSNHTKRSEKTRRKRDKEE